MLGDKQEGKNTEQGKGWDLPNIFSPVEHLATSLAMQ